MGAAIEKNLIGGSTETIPSRGFGTFQADAQSTPPGTVKHAVLLALKLGYRHIDTAWAYGNGSVEREVGEGIRASGVPRDQIFVVTKLCNSSSSCSNYLANLADSHAMM